MKLPAFVYDFSLPPLDYHQQLRAWTRQIRDNSPIIWDDESESWLVFRYSDVSRVQSNYHIFSSEGTLGAKGIVDEAQIESSSIIEMDPPRHRQLRSLVTQALSPKIIHATAPRIEQIIDGLLNEIQKRGQGDWMEDLAHPLPLMVMMSMLDLPLEDWRQLKGWIDAIMDESNEALVAGEQFEQYLSHAVEARKEQPGHDVLSLLIASEVDGTRLNDDELMSFCFTLFLAGNLTTTHVLGNAMLLFNHYPEELERLRRQPELIPKAVEEAIRYMPPRSTRPSGLGLGRVAKTDVEICGQLVRKGEIVQINRFSANFDERHFSDPDRFDVGRTPNRHQSFGHGIHFCLGAPLAHLQIRLVFEQLLQHFRAPYVVSGAELKQVASPINFGVQHIPIVLGAATTQAN